MKKTALCFLPVLGAIFLLAADQPKIPPMPIAVANNAVAALKGGLEVYSLMGIGTKKTWDDVSNKVYAFHIAGAKWVEERPVPGVAGRLGASAIGARGQIFLFGGFVVDGQGNEMTVPDVNSYVPGDRRWYRGADTPVAVDDAVIGVNQNRYIYLVGGRSKDGPVNNVQVYDAEKNTWSQATPFPGTPVFGHAGGLADDAIVFVDGAKRNPASGTPYVTSDECWLGKIDHKDRDKITWNKLPPHPGAARFGIVAGAEKSRILFTGGSASFHNYKGMDADGKPIQLSTMTFDYEEHGNRWETIEENTFDPRSDIHGIASTPIGPMTIGGLVTNTAVSARVVIVPKK